MWSILTVPDRRGGKWDTKGFFETGVREIAQVLSYVKHLGVPLAQKRALDFGCGIGRLSQALAQYFEHVDGVDVAPSMIEQANKYNSFSQGCHYHLNTEPGLPLFKDDTFDFIYSHITLQHIEPRFSKQYISEFIRVLARRGLLVFQLPSRSLSPLRTTFKRIVAKGVLAASRHTAYMTRPIMVMHAIDQSEVRNLLELSGGRVIEIAPDQSSGDEWLSLQYCVTKD